MNYEDRKLLIQAEQFLQNGVLLNNARQVRIATSFYAEKFREFAPPRVETESTYEIHVECSDIKKTIDVFVTGSMAVYDLWLIVRHHLIMELNMTIGVNMLFRVKTTGKELLYTDSLDWLHSDDVVEMSVF